MSGNSSPLLVAVARTLTYSVACPDYEPFKDISDDRLAEASQWVLFSVLFTALLIRVDVAKEDKDDQEKLGIILVVLTLVPVLYAVALTMSDLNQKFSEGREKFKEIKTKAKPLELELGSMYGRISEAVGRSNEGDDSPRSCLPCVQKPKTNAAVSIEEEGRQRLESADLGGSLPPQLKGKLTTVSEVEFHDFQDVFK